MGFVRMRRCGHESCDQAFRSCRPRDAPEKSDFEFEREITAAARNFLQLDHAMQGKAASDLKRAYIFVANHASVLDTPILCHIPISKKYLTKSTYFNIPIFGWTQRVVGDIGVDVRYVFS